MWRATCSDGTDNRSRTSSPRRASSSPLAANKNSRASPGRGDCSPSPDDARRNVPIPSARSASEACRSRSQAHRDSEVAFEPAKNALRKSAAPFRVWQTHRTAPSRRCWSTHTERARMEAADAEAEPGGPKVRGSSPRSPTRKRAGQRPAPMTAVVLTRKVEEHGDRLTKLCDHGGPDVPACRGDAARGQGSKVLALGGGGLL